MKEGGGKKGWGKEEHNLSGDRKKGPAAERREGGLVVIGILIVAEKAHLKKTKRGIKQHIDTDIITSRNSPPPSIMGGKGSSSVPSNINIEKAEGGGA